MSRIVDPVFNLKFGPMVMHSHTLDTVTSDPASADEGSIILNTTDYTIKVYYAGSWQTLHTLTPPVDNGNWNSSTYLWDDAVVIWDQT